MSPYRSPGGGRFAKGIMALGVLSLSLAAPALASNNDDVPRGTLNIDRDIVRVGTHSQLDWEIDYPSGVTEIVDIIPPNRIVPKKHVRMKVRVLGVAFQAGWTQLPLDAYASINGAGWDRFFYGRSYDVNPHRVLIDRRVGPGDTIDFGARGWNNGWLPFHHSLEDDRYMTILKDGDTAPDYAPAYNQGSVVSFLRPYMDGDKVSIGERDLIILWEASTAAPGTTYFDMQDLVVLVTFE